MGSMEMAKNAMQTARQGAEIAGHNLANASNPIYARQRVKISSAVAIPTDKGTQGTGSEVARLEQIRDYTIDKALVSEKSVTKYLEAKQLQLRRAEASLGETLDQQSIDAGESYGSYGVADGLTGLFNSFQSLSSNPTSIAERQAVLFNAQKLTDKMNIVDRRLGDLRSSINDEVKDEIDNVNAKIEAIAYLATSIGNTKVVEGAANEIRDAMQESLEDLSESANIITTTNERGKLSLFVDGYEMVTDNAMTGSVKLHTDSNGMRFLADSKSGDVLTLQSGSVKGLIDARDDSIKNLQDQLNSIANNLISEVNTLHQTGFNLSGTNDSSLKFFTGTNASDIGVNSTITDDPRLLQTAGTTISGHVIDGNPTSTDIITKNAHGYTTGQAIIFSGSAPTGASVGVNYYVNATGTNNFKLHETRTDALSETSALEFSSDGSFDMKTFDVGDNTVIRAMAEAGTNAVSGLSDMTYGEYYGNTVSRFGQDIALTDTQLIDQQAVQTMLEKQRDSVQGVSIDEEVADLVVYQRAFQASARMISTMDTLMGDILNMQR